MFGKTVALILRDTLKRWGKAMRAKVRSDPELRPIKEAQHVNLIMDYLKVFQHGYESKFGLMEETKQSVQCEVRDNTMHIRTTGYGAKVFLGLVMADRVHVVDRKRRHEREKIGFVAVDPSKLPADSKDCSICQDAMGVQTPEGEKESPVKLVICCGQIVGEECLKTWLNEVAYGDILRETCPVCRYKFPAAFLEKLFGEQEEEDDEDVDIEEPTVQLPTRRAQSVIDLVGPSPSPERLLAGLSSRQAAVLTELMGVTPERRSNNTNGMPIPPRTARTVVPRPIGLLHLLGQEQQEREEAHRRGVNNVDDFEMEG
jgi:hypothetical protein